jgi:hypothetical protein
MLGIDRKGTEVLEVKHCSFSGSQSVALRFVLLVRLTEPSSNKTLGSGLAYFGDSPKGFPVQ